MSGSLGGLLARMVGHFALRHFVPLYTVYALLLAVHGMTRPAISSLFAVWSVTSFVLEAPRVRGATSCRAAPCSSSARC